MWTGSVSPVIRQKAKGVRPARNLARRAARRHALPGYPVEPRKFSLEEINSYLRDDRIVCLRCGKSYKSLATHINRIHGLTGDEYRDMYGLPWGRGLITPETRQNHSKSTISRIEAGWQPRGDLHLMMQAIKKHGHRNQPFRREQNLKNIANLLPNGSPYPEDIFDQMLLRISEGRTVKQVCQDHDMPKRTWLQTHFKENPDDRDRLMVLLDTMPFDFQARNQMGFGPRFWSELEKFRRQGLSDHEIAKQTGLAAMTINRQRRKRGIT